MRNCLGQQLSLACHHPLRRQGAWPSHSTGHYSLILRRGWYLGASLSQDRVESMNYRWGTHTLPRPSPLPTPDPRPTTFSFSCSPDLSALSGLAVRTNDQGFLLFGYRKTKACKLTGLARSHAHLPGQTKLDPTTRCEVWSSSAQPGSFPVEAADVIYFLHYLCTARWNRALGD